jgi:hypothetical protein
MLDIDMDDSVSPEMLAAALALSEMPSKYKIYFDKETGDILSITNEFNESFSNFVEVELEEVSDFLNDVKSIFDYKLIFAEGTGKPVLMKQYSNTDATLLVKIPRIKPNRSAGIVIENDLKRKRWVFSIPKDVQINLQNFSLNTMLEFYIVNADNDNYLYRTLEVPFADLLKKKIKIDHESQLEQQYKKFKLLTSNKFFINFGYKVLNVEHNQSN